MVRPGLDLLSGKVEVDETYIGGEKAGKQGRGAAGKSPVLVAVEDKGSHFGRIRLHRIYDASAESIIPAVKKSVKPGITIFILMDGEVMPSCLPRGINTLLYVKMLLLETTFYLWLTELLLCLRSGF